MIRLAEPHAGVLVDRFAHEVSALRERARQLPQLTLDEREAADLALIATGAASPLTGFMGLRDYRSVLARLRLANGVPWPIPFTLAVTIPEMAQVLRAQAAALRDAHRRLLGIIDVTDAFVRNSQEEAEALYGTRDPAHPGVAYLLSRPPGTVGGSVTVLPGRVARTRSRIAMPREVRSLARRRGWAELTGLATAEGLSCVEGGAGGEATLLAAAPVALRHTPGRDAMLHAIVLKNYGAREVFLEYERGEWLSAWSQLGEEDLGIAPQWLVRVAATRTPGRAPLAAHA